MREETFENIMTISYQMDSMNKELEELVNKYDENVEDVDATEDEYFMLYTYFGDERITGIYLYVADEQFEDIAEGNGIYIDIETIKTMEPYTFSVKLKEKIDVYLNKYFYQIGEDY